MRRPKESTITHAEALTRIITECQIGPERADAIDRILWRLAPERITLREAASRFGVSNDTIMRFHRAGKLPACNAGFGATAYYLFDPADLAECFRTSTPAATPARPNTSPAAT